MVNVRGLPNGEVVRKGCYAPKGIYNVKSKKQVDGYWWYEIDKANWVREGEWITYYPIDRDIAKLENEIEDLKTIMAQIETMARKAKEGIYE